jgi:hypothetical protein
VRDKVLIKFCKMLRIVNDERTPEGERQAATARLDALLERWQFTDIEIGRQIECEADAEEGHVAKQLRAQREFQQAMRRAIMQQQHAMMAGFVEVGASETTTTIIFTKGFA